MIMEENQTFKQVEQYQELQIKNPSELMLKLFNIYGNDNLPYVKRTFENLMACQQHKNFNFFKCDWCGAPIWKRIPCTSFFCDKCRKILANRLKEKLLTYIWNIPHRFAVFTLPPEIQDICKGWASFIFNKKGFNLATNLIYKSVGETIKEYFAKRDLEVGFIMYPHTESTFDLSWFFHLNVLISTRGLKKSSKFTNYNKKTNTRIIPSFQARYQTYNTYFIDYDEIKEIYLKKLSKNFKTKIKEQEGNPIHFEGKLYPKQISQNLFGYVRKLLLKEKHIIKTTASTITLKRWNKKEKRYKEFTLSWKEFYDRAIQHIPPKFMRTIRLWGSYCQSNKKRYFLEAVTTETEKKLSCKLCGASATLMYSIHRGQLIKIEEYYLLRNFKKFCCMLDMIDFNFKQFLEMYQLKDGFYVKKAKTTQALECPIELYPINFTNEDDLGIEKYKLSLGKSPRNPSL